MAIAIKTIKPGKEAGPYEVCVDMISTSGRLEIDETLPTGVGWKRNLE